MGKWRQHGIFKKLHSDGYLMTFIPTHSRASDGYVFDHILKAESILEKPLPPQAVIHHHNYNQLVICQNQGFHLLIHQRTRAFIASGHATWRKCIFCKQYDSPKNMVLISTRALHRDCENRYRKLQYYRRKEDGK